MYSAKIEINHSILSAVIAHEKSCLSNKRCFWFKLLVCVLLDWTQRSHSHKKTTVFSDQYLLKNFASSHAEEKQIVIVPSTQLTVAQQGGSRSWERGNYCVACTMIRKRKGIDRMCLFWSTHRLNVFTRDIMTYSTVCLGVYISLFVLEKERTERKRKQMKDAHPSVTFQRPWNTEVNMIPTFIDYLWLEGL